jgi:hypothetical protein
MAKSKVTLSNDFVGAAGVHHIASQLAWRGLIAMPTIRNTSGIDILVTDPLTNASAILQVKTSQKKVGFWPTSLPQKCPKGRTCFYTFVRYLGKERRFQVFLEDSERVVEGISEVVNSQKKRGRKVFPCWVLPKNKAKQKSLETKWNNWRPPR